jgi:hypothetical protein
MSAEACVVAEGAALVVAELELVVAEVELLLPQAASPTAASAKTGTIMRVVMGR